MLNIAVETTFVLQAFKFIALLFRWYRSESWMPEIKKLATVMPNLFRHPIIQVNGCQITKFR